MTTLFETYVQSICAAQRAALLTYGVREIEGPSEIADEQITLDLAREHCRVDLFGSPPESDDDSWFTNVGIPAAREYCERELGRSLVPRTMELATSAFPTVAADSSAGACFTLPFGPVQSITSITYYDATIAQAAYDAAYTPAYDAAYTAAYDAEILNSGDPEAADAAGIAAGTAAGVAAGDVAYDAALEVTIDPSVYSLDVYQTRARVVLSYGQTWPTHRGDLHGVKVRYLTGYNLDTDSPIVYRLPRLVRAAMLAWLEHLHANRDLMASDSDPGVPPGVGRVLALVPGRERFDFV